MLISVFSHMHENAKNVSTSLSDCLMTNHSTLQDYLQFISYCLSSDSQSVPTCAKRMDWTGLLQFAEKQSIVGVCWQGVRRMDELNTNKPTEDEVLEWMAKASKIAKQNKKVNGVAAKVVAHFQQQGFEACVLKGQGNAQLYPDPLSRTPGDIDIYVHPKGHGEDWTNDEAAVNQVIGYCKGLDASARAVYHHIDIPAVDKVPVEVHYRPTWMNTPAHNRRLQRTLAALLSQAEGTKQVTLPEDAGQIVVPGFRFNVIFQLSHILNHLLHEGVGLRQLIDYYYLLKSHEGKEDEKVWLNKELKSCGLWHVSEAVSWMLIVELGLPEAYLVSPPNERYGKQLMREIIAGGNFGKYDDRLLSGVSHSKLVANLQRLVRDARMMVYYPSECLWEPWFRLWHWMWRKKHN